MACFGEWRGWGGLDGIHFQCTCRPTRRLCYERTATELMAGLEVRPLFLVKARRWVRIWLRIWVRDAIKAIFNREQLLQLFAIPFFLFLVFAARGPDAMKEQFGIVSAARMALLFALPCYLLLNLVFAAFKVVWEERTKGEWIGRRFVYFEPVLARSEFVMAANNNKISKFRFKDAEPGSMIYYKFQRDGPETYGSSTSVV